MTDNTREVLRAANQRADREVLLRLGLLDRIEVVLHEDHDTVEGLKAAIEGAFGVIPDDTMMGGEPEGSAQIAERRSAQAAELMRGILDDLHLTPEQKARAAETLPRLLRSLEADLAATDHMLEGDPR